MKTHNDTKKYIIAGGAALLLLAAAGLLFNFVPRYRSGGDIEDKRLKQIGAYERVLEADPSDVSALVKLANLYKSIGEIDKAIDYYKKALMLDPANYEALNELGHAYALKEIGRAHV